MGVAKVPCFRSDGYDLSLHVATQILTDGDQQILKTRHIGNDWVSVVWSEGERDFTPATFTSQLAAAVIVIYPHRRALPDARLCETTPLLLP